MWNIRYLYGNMLSNLRYGICICNGNGIWCYVNDKLHRTNGPAVFIYNRSGQIEYEQYYINGKVHRLNKPAIIDYYDTGKIAKEIYYVNDVKHRLNEPAKIYYCDIGIFDKYYYEKGERIKK